jgi:hypothetical protein
MYERSGHRRCQRRFVAPRRAFFTVPRAPAFFLAPACLAVPVAFLAAVRLAGAAFRAGRGSAVRFAAVFFRPRAATTLRAFRRATFTCRRTPLTARRTVRRTARLGFVVCSTAAAAPAAMELAAAPARADAPAVPAAPAPPDAASAVSTITRVALPRVLPIASAARVRTESSAPSCGKSSAMVSPCAA